MPTPLPLLATPADAGVRMLALSWLEQTALRAELLRDPRRTDDWTLANFADALRRLETHLGAGDPPLRRSVGPRTRARLRALARMAEAGVDLRRYALWTREQLPALETRQQPGAAWLLGRLADLSARTEGRLRRELGESFHRLHHRLARRLRVYTVEVELADAAPRPSMVEVLALAIQADADALSDGLADVATSPGVRTLRRCERVAARVRHRLEVAGGYVPPGSSPLASANALWETLDGLRRRHSFGEMLARAAAAESAARVSRAMAQVLHSGSMHGVRDPLRTNARSGFLALGARLGVETAGSRDALRRRWLGGRSDSLIRELRAAAASLRAPVARPAPIEREADREVERETAWGMDREMERELGRELRLGLVRDVEAAV
jgi:hypothetical protein